MEREQLSSSFDEKGIAQSILVSYCTLVRMMRFEYMYMYY